MKRLVKISTPAKLFAVSSLVIAMAACSPASNTENKNAQPAQTETAKAPKTEPERLAAFFAESRETDLKRSPMTQSYMGIKWDYDKWGDFSDANADETRTLMETRLKQASEFDVSTLNDSEKLSLDIYQIDLKRKLANDEFRHHTYIMDQFSAWHTTVPSFLINIHRIENEEDARAYISRLNKVEALFDQVIAQLRVREKLGVMPPAWSYDQMMQAAANVVKGNPFSERPEDSTILADFKQKLDATELSNAEKSGLITDANAALLSSVKPAYEKLIQELGKQRLLTPEGDGVWRLPNGSEWYQNRLNWFTTTELNAQEVHQIGLDNVTRIHNQMREIMKQVKFEGSLQDFFLFMRNDDQFYYADSDEGRERYMTEAKEFIDKMEAKLPEYFGLTPKARMVVKRVEAFREQSAGKAFYQSPSKDGSRPGTYYANLFDMRSMPTYQMEALAYHEGIPGHHMQRAIAQELDGIPEFQKYVSFTAYTEGWGLYTEELGKDIGFYADPYSDFGRLAMELWRACRLVVDTGIHEMQWSREKAIQYLIDNTPNPEADSVKAIERYIAMPGQATAYMIGKIKIMELRDKAQAELGDKFDYRGFHDTVLKDGPVPLTLLEENVNKWIAASK
ncbi:DUF885 domain-containing protein [Brumicola nitratireducens]|uniref:Lipoprotein n=1 Tax=Glaciecola nitratireducens (strain JCM 12485 / KCTC 12276 / FR1064) TaxID=1085623 RepID=G4QKC5_GLANF|nr:DUF885 domain-containing protein [Glaciecola nitratireducens]AEP29324.1 hypothetical protein GNIT_1197 [Glaciecola nitratireducens FR1064]